MATTYRVVCVNRIGNIEIIEKWPFAVGEQFAGDRAYYWAANYGYLPGPHYAIINWKGPLPEEGWAHLRREAGKIGGRVGGRLGVASQLRQGIHSTQTGKGRAQCTAALSRAAKLGLGAAAQLARGVHVSQTGNGGFQAMDKDRLKEISINAGRKGILLRLARGDDTAKALRQTATCPHCGITAVVGNIGRWHLDRCKQKEEGV